MVVFTARDDTHGVELWRSNGQADGTSLVADIAPGADERRPQPRPAPPETASSTSRVPAASGAATARPRAPASSPPPSTPIDHRGGSRCPVRASRNQHGLWRVAYADGTATPIGDFPNSQIVPSLTLVGDRLFFAVSSVDEELWTQRRHRRRHAAGAQPSQLANREGGNEQTQLFAVGAPLFFVGHDDGAAGSCGAATAPPTGTRRVRDINPGHRQRIHFNDYWEMPQPFFAALGDTLLFMANDGVTGLELWRSDGTEAGTQRLTDVGRRHARPRRHHWRRRRIRRRPEHHHACCPTAGRLFFTARPSGLALELWESDGTAAGTRQVAPLGGDWATLSGRHRRRRAAVPEHAVDRRRHEAVDQRRHRRTAPRRSRRRSGTRSELTPAFGGILFGAEDAATGRELWCSDGTAAGTRRVADIARGRPDLNPEELTALGDTLYFRGRDVEHGEELWRSDGTAAGTMLVADIAPGATSSSPQWLVASGSTLYFAADGGEHGRGLWRSDGTAAGTRLVRAAESDGSDPSQLVADAHGGVYFFAAQPTTGYELWHSDGTVRPAPTWCATSAPAPTARSPSRGRRCCSATRCSSAPIDAEHGAELWRSDGSDRGHRVGGRRPTRRRLVRIPPPSRR